MDAFLAAFLIPNLLINLVAESMNQALIPTLIRVRIREGYERAQQLLSNSMLWLCGLLTAASLLMALLARAFFPLIGSDFGRQAGPGGPSFLCAAPGGAAEWDRHQLHCGPECG